MSKLGSNLIEWLDW